MAKSKTKDSKKVKPTEVVTPVKSGSITKPSKTDKSKKVVKEVSKKKKKVVEPESESESESESSSESEADNSSDSDSSEDEKPTKKPVTNGKTKAKAKAPASESESESDSESASGSDSESDSDSESEEEKPKAKKPEVNGGAKLKADSSDSESDSGSDSDSESEEKEKKAAPKAAKKAQDSDDSDSEEDSDDSGDSDESDASESDEADAKKTEAAPSKKRKAEEEIDEAPKKTKTDGPTTLFVGSLSWGIDDDALYEAFQEIEGLNSARVMTERDSGRSRGFGYVDFNDAESCTKAYETMQGKDLGGRTINLDYANARPAEGNTQARAADRAKRHGDTVSPESDTLFVGNLPFDVDQDLVHNFFNEVAPVASVRLPTDPDTGNLKGFGYVSFNSVEDAKTVLSVKNGAPIGTGRMSRSVRLDYSGPRPQRDGGGFGGRGGGGGGFGGRGGGRGRGGFGGRGGGRGGGGRGGRGGFGGGRGGGPSYSGTKISFD